MKTTGGQPDLHEEQLCETTSRTYDHLNVKVDGEGEDLSTEVTSSELLDEIRVLHWQTLGELHCSEGEDEVGDL
jgi:hypothetical protein